MLLPFGSVRVKLVHAPRHVLNGRDGQAGGGEPGGLVDVPHGQGRSDVHAAGALAQPPDADTADLDVLVALQRCDHRRLPLLAAAVAPHTRGEVVAGTRTGASAYS